MKLSGGQCEGVIFHHHPLLEGPSCMSPNCSFTFFFSRISLQHYNRVQIDAVSTASQKLPSHLAQPDPPAKKANKKNDLKGRFLKFKGLTTSEVPGDIGNFPTSDRWNFLIGTGTSIAGDRWGRIPFNIFVGIPSQRSSKRGALNRCFMHNSPSMAY